MMSRAGWNRAFPRRLLTISTRTISPKTEAAAAEKQNIPEIRIMENEIFSEQPFAPIISKVNSRSRCWFQNFQKQGFSLLILNGCAINKENLLLYSTFQKLWTQSSYRHAADGGLNTLYDLDKESPSVFIPHCVSGDFDSVSNELIEEYKAYGVDIQETPDQHATDFEKGKILNKKNQPKIMQIFQRCEWFWSECRKNQFLSSEQAQKGALTTSCRK